jgi:hypothetical protein
MFLRYPAQIAFNFAGINGIAKVMSRTVSYISNQICKLFNALFNTISSRIADGLHNIDIFTLVMATNIVVSPRLQSPLYIERTHDLRQQPVTDLLTVAVNWQGLPARAFRIMSGISFSGKWYGP